MSLVSGDVRSSVYSQVLAEPWLSYGRFCYSLRQHLYERGFTSTRFHDFETASKSMRFGSVYTETFSPENPSRAGVSERCTCTTCYIYYFALNNANFAPK